MVQIDKKFSFQWNNKSFIWICAKCTGYSLMILQIFETTKFSSNWKVTFAYNLEL